MVPICSRVFNGRSGKSSEKTLLGAPARRASLWIILALPSLALACGTAAPPAAQAPAGADRLTVEQIAELIPARVKERSAWAQAVFDALRGNGLETERPHVCAVLAVVAQESSFQEDPVVPGLARMIAARLESYRSKLGPLGRPLFQRLLAGRAPGDPRSFDERLAKVRTERDLDLVFRDLLAYHQSSHPVIYDAASLAGKLVDGRSLAELNPITTAGSMQVSVRFAEAWARQHHGREAAVRDALYTRAGGVYYGTARLFGHQASYPSMIYRFADYNAGVYASRNAALQAQLATLTGKKLALDGDFLGYGADGEVADDQTQTMEAVRLFRERFAPRISDRRAHLDARQEKALAFENTETYRAIKSVFATRMGTVPPYATLPQVTLESPKLSRKLSTSWFAESVDRRHQACLRTSVPR